MKDYAEKENELRNARIVLRQELEQKEIAKRELKELEGDLIRVNEELNKSKDNLEYIKLNEKTIKSDILGACESVTKKTPIAKPAEEISRVGEFKITAPISQSEKKMFVILNRLNVDYFLEIGDSLSGNKTRLVNFFSKFEQQIDVSLKRIESIKEKREALQGQIAYSSTIPKKIEELERELSAIFEQIKGRDDTQ